MSRFQYAIRKSIPFLMWAPKWPTLLDEPSQIVQPIRAYPQDSELPCLVPGFCRAAERCMHCGQLRSETKNFLRYKNR